MKKVYRNENLDYWDFNQFCLIGVKFYNCSIRFCDFQNSDLSYALFDSCDLYCSNFNHSIIYTTRFHSCDVTKAIFKYSFLNGIRIKDTVITYADFGEIFNTGKERKPIRLADVSDGFLKTKIEKLPANIRSIESDFNGIYCTTTGIAISFIEPQKEEWRIWRRKSEISKSIKNILEENGYDDKSLDYYFYYRKFLRKSFKNSFQRANDFIWGELFWGYGVRVKNPVIAYFLNCLLFSFVYSALPIFSVGSGIKSDGVLLNIISMNNVFDISSYLEILYSSILISSLSVFGNIEVLGLAKTFSIIHVLISILSMGLGITALTKRMANI